MAVDIRFSTMDDVPRMRELLEIVNMHDVPSDEVPMIDWADFFVGLVDGVIVGLAGFAMVDHNQGKTTLMTVHPDFRGHSLGRLLQERRMIEMFSLGAKTIITNADRPETIAWYKKHFGYLEIGKVKKLHDFGLSDVDEWTTLITDLVQWMGEYATVNH